MTAKKLRRALEEWRGVLVTAPCVALLVIALKSLGGLQLLEWAALDLFFRWRPAEPTEPKIVLVEISESDIRQAGRWPISDAVLAQLIEKIQAQQPRVIGLDLFRDLPVEPGHQQLVQVFETTPNLIGAAKVVSNSYSGSVAPPPTLARLGRVGASDILLDADGKVRRALLSVRPPQEKTVYSLSVRLALIYLEQEGITLQTLDAASGRFGLGKAVFTRLTENFGGYVGVDAGGYQILANFRSHGCRRKGKARTCQVFPTVSMTDVLQNRVKADLLRDRIVLIGSTAESLKDRFFIPYTRNYLNATTGVEIHADLTSQIIQAALNNRPLIQTWSEPIESVWTAIWSSIGAVLGFWWLQMRWKAISLFLVGGCLVVGSYAAFIAGWWIPVVPPLLAMSASSIAITAYVAYIERQDRETVMNLLGQHVSPKIAQAVWSDRHQFLKEGQILGQKMTATVLFTDIKGFTTIAEKTDPERLMFWLNDYMKVMSQVVLDRDGVVDKFIGDAVMAVFGVPIPRTTAEAIATDAIAAVSCAVEMATKLRQLNQQWQQQGFPVAAMRVGIATGTVVAGSLGSRQRLNYTTIGDSVNIASRLESYDKSIDGGDCRILISKETYLYIQDRFPTRYVGCAQLRGRDRAIEIYQVLT